MTQDTITTVGKMAIVSATGIGMSLTDVETVLRISSVIVTMGLSTLLFIKNWRKK